MNLHEYQAKRIFAQYDLPVSKGYVCYDVSDALTAMTRLGGAQWVVKCQIHAGGRGKASGVRVVKSEQEVRSFFYHFF